MKQLHFDDLHFDGETIDPEKDNKRLGKQLSNVFLFMMDGKWRTLSEIAKTLGYPEASISARLRDFRKSRFGSFIVERERIGKGLYRYRLVK